jgi:two-component system phosphate regulon sensor histidine kinase PhoR
MNKSAFMIFAALSLVTGAVVLLVKNAGMDLSVFIIVIISVFIGITAAVVYAKRVKMLIKQVVFSARNDLQIYNLPYSSSPGMNDIASIIKLIITKAKESEEQLNRNIDDIKKIMDAVDIGILVVNRHGSVVYANEYMKRFASLGRDLTGIYFLDIIRSYEAEALFNAVVAGSPFNQKEISLFTPEETKFSLHMKQIEYCTHEQCYLMTLKDITRLKQIEIVRQDFITNASHELKTPLTSIIGYLEALKENYNKDFVNTVYKNAKRMQRIVDDMLVLSKADRGSSEFTVKEVSISDVISEIQSLLNNEIEKKHQRVIVHIPDELDVVYADREALFHILLNLIDNAIKYTNERGEISVSAYDKDKETEIVVRDTGSGIPSNELDRIFERFYTVDKARSRALGGTGLGLSIVKHFVLAHNGKIWVESALNKGSAFHFTIPKKK